MALDNQFLLTTVLVLGLGYFIMKSKPQELAEDTRKAIDAQNIDAQFDQIDEIFDEFKIEWSKRGDNAASTPITVEERDVLAGLERNLQRINKEVGKLKPFNPDDLHGFANRRDRMYERIGRYKKKFPQAVLQATKDSRVLSKDLGDIVEAGAHFDLFNSVVPRATAATVLGRAQSVSRYLPSTSRLPDSRSRSITERFGRRNAQSLSTHSAPDLKSRTGGISKVRARRAARGKSVGQTPFDMAPLSGKRVNKDKPSDSMVLKHERGAFETTSAPSNNISQVNARHTNQEADELNGDRAKETPAFVGPMDTTPAQVPTGFNNGKGLVDDAVDMEAAPPAKPIKVKGSGSQLRKVTVQLSPQTEPQMNSAPGPGISDEERGSREFSVLLGTLDASWTPITKQEFLNRKYQRTLAVLQNVRDLGGKMRKSLDKTFQIHSARIQKSLKTRAISQVVIPSVQAKQSRPKRARKTGPVRRKPPPIPLPERIDLTSPRQATALRKKPALQRAPSSLVGIGAPNMNAAPTLP